MQGLTLDELGLDGCDELYDPSASNLEITNLASEPKAKKVLLLNIACGIGPGNQFHL